MEPTGTETYNGHQIRYFDNGVTKLSTEDFLKVVPAARENLKEGEFVLIDTEVAAPLATTSGNEDFGDWINETFPQDLISGK
jgi:hypothetical protein